MNLFAEPIHVPSGTVRMRPYQEKALQAIEADMDRGPGQGLLVLPTGTGKTSVFTELIARRRRLNPDFRALILAHQIELLDQAAGRIRHMIPGAIVGTESGDHRASTRSEVVVAGVQSIGRRGNTKLEWLKPDLIITDEAHHACADSYQAVYDNFGVYTDDGPYHLGVTATPHRMDNKPLHGSDRAIFSKILYQYTLKEAIADGFLSNVRGYRVAAQGLDLSGIKKTAGDYNQRELQTVMDTDEVTASGITSWGRVAKNRRTLVFCTGVEHAANVAKAFRALGFRAESIDGSMRPEMRDAVMRRFRSGETQVLTNMQLVTEGVDIPEIGCVLLLRPTQSWALYTQMCGRGMRLSAGKEDCIIIDVVGNSEAHQLGKNPPASLAGVFGLPPGLDLSGKLATEAVEIFDELTDSQQSGLFKRILDMDGLSAALTEVDLLAELGIPGEIEGFTAWSWMKLGDGHYMLGCGSNATEGRMRADMFEDAIGEWTLILKSDQRNEKHDLGDNLRGAFRTAERLAASRWPEVGRVVDTRAAWRKAPPSDKQVDFLRKIGIKAEDIARMNKGQASTLMSQHFAKQKRGVQ